MPIEEERNRSQIFDPIRRKYVVATPEENVRQYFIRLLHEDYGYPYDLMANEYSIEMGLLSRRCDTVIFDRQLSPLVIVEYKAPSVDLSQHVVEQVFRYNSVLKVPYIYITNGRRMALYKVGYQGEITILLSAIPRYAELVSQVSKEDLLGANE